MVQKLYDELAYGMEQVLADESYQKIFAKPKIKTASAQQPEVVKLSSDGILDTFTTLVTLSGKLDDMGYQQSATQLLKAAQEIRDEARIDEFEPGDGALSEYLGDLEEGHDKSDGDAELDDLLRELGKGGGAWDLNQKSTDLPDLGDVMDKPSENDDHEGNPEC